MVVPLLIVIGSKNSSWSIDEVAFYQVVAINRSSWSIPTVWASISLSDHAGLAYHFSMCCSALRLAVRISCSCPTTVLHMWLVISWMDETFNTLTLRISRYPTRFGVLCHVWTYQGAVETSLSASICSWRQTRVPLDRSRIETLLQSLAFCSGHCLMAHHIIPIKACRVPHQYTDE